MACCVRLAVRLRHFHVHIGRRQVYYIGDSKYYKEERHPEGYNITPNFFICGSVDRKKGFSDDALEADSHDFTINYQFPNRIFDRDTLFLREYNINFLFVLYAYTAAARLTRNHWSALSVEVLSGG